MRKFMSALVVAAFTVTASPLAVGAAPTATSAVFGTAYRVDMRPFSNAEIQIRNVKTGYRMKSTVSDEGGTYSFKGLPSGTYVVEIVDRSGKILGMSAPFELSGQPMVDVSVVAVGQGAAAAGGRAGFSLLGLGPVSSLAVIGAAGAAGVTAVVATRSDASPSR